MADRVGMDAAMTHNEFNRVLSRIFGLSPGPMRRLARELETRLEATARDRPVPAKATAGRGAEETAFDVANRAGRIGRIKGGPGSPTGLITNPKSVEGFGLEGAVEVDRD